MFLFVVIAFIGLCELYVRFQEMRYHKERGTEYDSAMSDLDSAMTRRTQLIGALNDMRPEGDESQLSSKDGQTKVYSEYYGGLERGEYLLCAWVFVPMSDPTKVACILAPKGPQKLLSIAWRAHSEDDLSGFLEDYGQYDALNTDTEILPDFEKVTEEIFTGAIGQKLPLGKRDVLSSRPNGLSDEEWCRVIWMD
ncbi:MAG: hypothetical protein LUD83_08170 [Clostridiales bacterium]|nr:hypothetical protein [Clostridiales bacterium]